MRNGVDQYEDMHIITPPSDPPWGPLDEKRSFEEKYAQGTRQEATRKEEGSVKATAGEGRILGTGKNAALGSHKLSKTLAPLSQDEAAVLDEGFRVLTAALNLTRLKMLEFCSQPRRYTEIVKHFSMNPASFKFHQQALRSEGLLKKEGTKRRTRYLTTPIGRVVLENVTQIITGPVKALRSSR